MQLEEQSRPSDEIDNTHKKFTEQVIKSASKQPEKRQSPGRLRQQREFQDKLVEQTGYKLIGAQPKKDLIDKSMIQ